MVVGDSVFEKIMKKLNLGITFLIILYLPIMYTLRIVFLPFFSLKALVYFYVLLYLLMPIYIFIYVYNLIKKKNRITKYDVLIFILIILGIITTVNAVDIETSLWGAYKRNEGLLVIISYYLLFLNGRSLEQKNIKKVINCVFLAGILQCIYSILQVFMRGNIAPSFVTPYMASGFIGNPNFLGSFCVLILGLSISMYFIYKNRVYFWLSIIYFVNLILAQSTGPFYAFVAMFIFLIVLLCVKKIIDLKKMFILIGTLIFTFLIVSFGSEFFCEKVYGDKISPSLTIKGDIINTLSLFLPSDGDGGDSKEEII